MNYELLIINADKSNKIFIHFIPIMIYLYFFVKSIKYFIYLLFFIIIIRNS